VDGDHAIFWVLVGPLVFFASIGGMLLARRAREGRAYASIDGLRADFAAMAERAMRGEHEAVQALANKLLAFCSAPSDIQTIYGALALSAETTGDFAACDEFAGRARATGAKAIDDRILAARRAFCLAALGRLEQAEGELPPISKEPLVVRAHALVASKRGEHAKVLELLADPSLDASVGPKSKALFEALRAHAGRTTAYRTASPAIDAETSTWVKSVAPHLEQHD
jgi:hypothetical protein